MTTRSGGRLLQLLLQLASFLIPLAVVVLEAAAIRSIADAAR